MKSNNVVTFLNFSKQDETDYDAFVKFTIPVVDDKLKCFFKYDFYILTQTTSDRPLLQEQQIIKNQNDLKRLRDQA